MGNNCPGCVCGGAELKAPEIVATAEGEPAEPEPYADAEEPPAEETLNPDEPDREEPPKFTSSEDDMYQVPSPKESSSPPPMSPKPEAEEAPIKESPKREAGAYLDFDEGTGSMLMYWKKDEGMPNCLMFAGLTNESKVPGHRYKGLGKSNLASNLQGNKQLYYQSFCEFVKVTRKEKCTMEVLASIGKAPIPVKIIVRTADNKVKELLPGGEVMKTVDIDAVAAVHSSSTKFDCVDMTRSLFLQVGMQQGYAFGF
eukprot:GHVU01171207.1.p1 GENE.GHVU01171207.1~~GHVU01171207.1.p1  ORF type:complete len:256 (+),score=44.86 GHVU01171207.1:306-1073(+)